MIITLSAKYSFTPARAVEGMESVPCVCVWLSVRLSALSWLNHFTLDDVSHTYTWCGHPYIISLWREPQCDVIQNGGLLTFLVPQYTSHSHFVMIPDVMWHSGMTSRDVTAWRLDTLWRLLGKNTNKEGTSREGVSTLRRFHFYLIKNTCITILKSISHLS